MPKLGQREAELPFRSDTPVRALSDSGRAYFVPQDRRARSMSSGAGCDARRESG